MPAETLEELWGSLLGDHGKKTVFLREGVRTPTELRVWVPGRGS